MISGDHSEHFSLAPLDNITHTIGSVFNALVKYSRGSVPMVAWFSMALIEGIFIKTYPSPANDLTGFIMMITCVALGLISIFGRDKE